MGITPTKVEQKDLLPPIYLFSLTPHKDAIHIPSLDVTYFQPFIDFSQYDYLIITSKQAVKALELYDTKEYLEKKALCISSATQKAYEALGGVVLESAKGYGDTLIEYIKKYPKTTKWLYLRAKEVASDFSSVLQKEGYLIDEEILYQTQCSKAIQKVTLPKNAILIFTSPSSIECFMHHHSFLLSHKVVVIGKTTAKKLPKNVKYILSKKTTIQGCIDIILENFCYNCFAKDGE